MSLQDTFNKLKTNIIGVKTSTLDDKLDNVISSISKYRSQESRNNYIELIKKLIANNDQLNFSNYGMTNSTISPTSMGQLRRLSRYKAYTAIVENINYCDRALNVYVENILSPDDITKNVLDVRPNKHLGDEEQQMLNANQIREIIDESKVEDKSETIVKNTLQFGDLFCELADSKNALTSRNIITETIDQKKSTFLTEYISEKIDEKEVRVVLDFTLLKDNDNQVEFLNETYNVLTEDVNVKEFLNEGCETTPGSFMGNLPYNNNDVTSYKIKDKIYKKSDNLKRQDSIHLIFYEPHRVVKLQSDLYPICFGYLVFPKVLIQPHLGIENQPIDALCQSILSGIKNKLPHINDIDHNESEIKDIINFMLINNNPSKAMEVRYIPPSRMVHFMRPSTKYLPYGESIFDNIQFSAKLLVAMETALTIQRLNRSTEKRKIGIEMGLPRDSRRLIEDIKETFRKRKISIDSFGSVDTIPSMITTFEDVYIPQKDGKAFIDIGTMTEGNIDTRSKIDEVKFLRDSMIASLNIPPSFLSIEENLSNKAALSEEQIIFARSVVSHQKYFSVQFRELIKKIMELKKMESIDEILDSVIIGLPTPRSLQYEREAKQLSDIASLIQTLEQIGIPREWAKKRYLPSIDWEDIKQYEVDKKIDDNLSMNNDQFGGMPTSGGY